MQHSPSFLLLRLLHSSLSFFFVGEVNFTCVQARVFPRVEAGDGSQGNDGVCMLLKYVRTLSLRGSSFNKPIIKNRNVILISIVSIISSFDREVVY